MKHANPDESLASREPPATPSRARALLPMWVGGAALAVVAAVVVVRAIAGGDVDTRFQELWGRFSEAEAPLRRAESAATAIERLEALLPQLRDSRAHAYGLWLAAIARYAEAFTPDKLSSDERTANLRKSLAHLDALRGAAFDESLLAKNRWFSGADQTPIDALSERVRNDLAWSEAHPYVEPRPADDVVVVLRTSKGDVHLQLFRDLAPRHVENFLDLARKGTYNGTAFHFLNGGTADPLGLMGGDPYSFFYNDPKKKLHILRWGTGGLGFDIPPEESRLKIRHRRGIVTSQRVPNADWDNAVQFQICTASNPGLDRIHTPFAVVVEGMAVLDAIIKSALTASQNAIYKDDADFRSRSTRDLLTEPVWIYKAIVYRGGIAEDHAFPLEEGEKRISSLATTPAAPLPEKDGVEYCGRTLRDAAKATEPRPGLDIPFPDGIDLEKASEKGERVSLPEPPRSPPPSPPPTLPPPTPPPGGAAGGN